MRIWYIVLFVGVVVLRLVELIALPVLGHATNCTSNPMDLYPWLMTAAVLPSALTLFLLASMGCLYFFDCCDNCNRAFGHTGVAMLIGDVVSLIWLCIGAFVAANLVDCAELGVAIFALVLLGVSVVHSIVVGIGLCCCTDL
jgi:hypothetical protein